MGLGSTAKKLQKVAETAEDVYKRLNEMREEIVALRETVTTTRDRVERLEVESAEQRALLEALAEERGIDVESVVADAHIDEAESPPGATDEATDETESGDGESSDGDTSADTDG